MAATHAGCRRLGQRPRSALSLSWLTGLSKAVGRTRRLRLGACAQTLPRHVRSIQRRPGTTPRPPERTRTPGSVMSLSAPIKVLMTTDAVGGVWTYSTGLASALAAAGMEVHLVTLGPRPREEKREMLRNPRVRLIESNLALEWQDAGGDDLPNARRFLEDLEDAIQPDVVHLNSFREATFDWLAPVVVVAHSCVKSWSLACEDTEWLSEAKWQHYTRAVAAGFDRTQAWVSPSQAFHDVICNLYRPSSPGTVIWNGIPSAASPPSSKRRFILAAGRWWDAGKNISLLAPAS